MDKFSYPTLTNAACMCVMHTPSAHCAWGFLEVKPHYDAIDEKHGNHNKAGR